MPVKVLFLDASGTILHPHPSVGDQYAALAREFGVDVEPATLEKGFRVAFRAARHARGLENLPYGSTHDEARAFWRPIVADAFAHAGHEMPGGDYLFRIYDRFATRACWRLDEGFTAVLELASSLGVRVGLLSNFDPRLRPLLDDMAIAHHFDPTIISCEYAVEKPSPALFAAARAACGNIIPDQIALVGDTPEEDIAGAVNAGWRVCLVDREDRYPRHEGLRARSLLEAVRCVLD